MLLAKLFPRRDSRSPARSAGQAHHPCRPLNLESLEERTLLSGWAFGLNGTADEFGNEIVVDNAGDVYVIGKFSGTVDFDPGPSTFNLTSANAYPYMDVFVAKYSSAGSFIWADQFTGTLGKDGKGIAVDAVGNVYTAGYFRGTVDFDPGPGTYNLTSPDTSNNGYVMKLDAGGSLVWVAQLGGPTTYAGPYSLALAADGSVLTTGVFGGTADLDPGPGNYSLTSAGGRDVFALKLDPSGNFVWAQRAGGATNDDGRGVAADSSGVYITGSFTGSADFGSTVLTSAATNNVFVAKLDVAGGSFQWAQPAVGAFPVEYGRSVALDSSGNLITTGGFYGTVDFDPGLGVTNLTDNGSGAGFVWKLDSSGNLVWARALDAVDPTAGVLGRSVAVDVAGNVYVDGGCRGAWTGLSWTTVACDFDPGPGTSILMASVPKAAILKLDSSGNFVWARIHGGSAEGTDDGGIAVDTSGNVFTTSTFVGQPANVDIGSTTVSVSNANGGAGYGLYIAKTTQDIPTTPQLHQMSDSPDPVAKGGTLTLAAYPVRIVPGGSNVASVSYYRDKNGNGTLEVGTDTLLGTDTNGSNGWSLTTTAPNKNGITSYFAQAKDSSNVMGNIVSARNRVGPGGPVASMVAVRSTAETLRQDTHATDTVLEDLLRHRGRGLARLLRRLR